MYSSPIETSGWAQIANVIASLLTNDPAIGLMTILLSTVVFLALLIGATWAIVKITRSRKQPAGVIFHEEVFTRNVLNMIKQLVSLNSERDRLSRKHEHIREHAVVRDQLTVVEGAQEEIRNILIADVSNRMLQKNPNYDGAISETRTFLRYEAAVDALMNEIFVFFRRAAKENHMVDKEEQEFYEYIGTKISRIYKLSQQSISAQSKDGATVEKIVKVFNDNWKNIEPIYRRLFTEMRTIASRYRTKIESEEADYEQRWSEFITRIPDMLMSGVTG